MIDKNQNMRKEATKPPKTNPFQKATREDAKLKIALTGPSGSGKTFSALRIATGIGGPIALIDTENKSASLYSDEFEFDAANMTPPYHTTKYIHAIKFAIENKYNVLIIDQISHAWAGEGGILQRKGEVDAYGGNSFTNWNRFTPEQENFMQKILHADIHMIVTMRSKQAYVLTDENGKKVPKKVGLAPVQREGVEYEFTTVLDIAMNHKAQATKDRTKIFSSGDLVEPSQELGKRFLAWVMNAEVSSDEEDFNSNPTFV